MNDFDKYSVSQFGQDPDSSMSPFEIHSNLSCYVCTTIDDAACRNINETSHYREMNTDFADLDQSQTSSLLGPYSLPENDPDLTSHEVGDMINTGDNHGAMMKISNFKTKCQENEPYCVVLKLSVSSHNAPEYNFFALQRNCAKQCVDGCFIIGNGMCFMCFSLFLFRTIKLSICQCQSPSLIQFDQFNR